MGWPLYTSDAADDPLCVDLGGRRIIKKKKPPHAPLNLQPHTTTNPKTQILSDTYVETLTPTTIARQARNQELTPLDTVN